MQKLLTKSSSTPLLNTMMTLVQSGFSESPTVVTEAFNAWSVLIDVLCAGAAGTTEQLSQKKRDLLMRPLVKRMKEPLASHSAVQSARGRAWWQLVHGLRGHTMESFAEVTIPMLQTLYLRKSAGLGLVGDLEVLGAEAVFNLLTTPTTTTRPSAVEGGGLPLLPTPMPQDTVAKWLLPNVELFMGCLCAGLESDRTSDVAIAAFDLLCDRVHQLFQSGKADADANNALKTITFSIARMCLVAEGISPPKPLVMIGLARKMMIHFNSRTLSSNAARLNMPKGLFAGTNASIEERFTEASPFEFLVQLQFRIAQSSAGDDLQGVVSAVLAELAEGALKTASPLRTFRVVLRELTRVKAAALVTPSLFGAVWLAVATPMLGYIDSKVGSVNSGLDFAPDYSTLTELLTLAAHGAIDLATAGEDALGVSLAAGWTTLLKAFVRSADLEQTVLSNVPICGVVAGVYTVMTKHATKVTWESKTALNFVAAAIGSGFNAGIFDAKGRSYAAAEVSARPLFKLVGLSLTKCHQQLGGAAREVGAAVTAATDAFANVSAISHCLAVTKTLTAWVPRLTMPEVVVELLRCLSAPLGLLLASTSDVSRKSGDYTKLRTAAAELWTTVATSLVANYQGDFDSNALSQLLPLFKNTLLHSHIPTRKTARTLWSKTFGEAVWLAYPEQLAPIITTIRRSNPKELTFPGWVDATLELGNAGSSPESPTETLESQQSQFSLPQSNMLSSPLKNSKRSFMGRKSASSPQAKPTTKSRGQQLQEAASAAASSSAAFSTPKNLMVFKTIAPSPQKRNVPLTEHQQEVRDAQKLKRKEQPSEYTSIAGTDDTQDSQSPTELPDEKDDVADRVSPTSRGAALVAAGLAAAAAIKSPLSALTGGLLRGGAGASALVEPGTPPTSILKRRRSGQQTSRGDGEDAKRPRRVSFDLGSNTNHIIEASPSKKAKIGLMGGARSVPANGSNGNNGNTKNTTATFNSSNKPSAIPLTLQQKHSTLSPPPKMLSPGNLQLPRSRTERLLFLAPQGQGRSPITKPKISPTKLIDVSPASDASGSAAARIAVKRNLELAMPPSGAASAAVGSPSAKSLGKRPSHTVPSPDATIFPGLGECSDQVSHVLGYFNVTNRRAVTQLLAGKKMHTVGDLCSLTRNDLNGLPMTVSKDTVSQLASYQARHSKTRHASPSPLGRSATSRIPQSKAESPVPKMVLEEEEGPVQPPASIVAFGGAGDKLLTSLGSYAANSQTMKSMGKGQLASVTQTLEKLLQSARSASN
jgi:hypothetical protein